MFAITQKYVETRFTHFLQLLPFFIVGYHKFVIPNKDRVSFLILKSNFYFS